MAHGPEGLTRRSFLGRAAAVATAAAAPLGRGSAAAQDTTAPSGAVSPPEIPTPGRPQGTDKFGASVDGLPIIDAHIHLFDGNRPETRYMGSAAYRAASKTSLPGLYA